MQIAGTAAAAFRNAILTWYDANRRDLPWRGIRDPWAVWVSEVMLQQTRVETVRPRFASFMAAFPTPAALAAAPEEAVLAHWSGLGYYRRARLLRSGASVVAERPGGAFPSDPVEALAIPGVGHYTAAAILSISFDLPHAVVDGNVARVLARIHRLEPPRDRPGTALRALAQALLDPGRPGDYNQAMMDLGAMVCLPARPECGRCPVSVHCLARTEGMVDQYPASRPRTPAADVEARLLLLRDGQDRILLEKGKWPLLPGVWIPVVRSGDGARPDRLPGRLQPLPGSLRDNGTAHHSITRHRVTLRIWTGRIRPGPGRLPAGYQLVSDGAVDDLGHSSILEKALRVEKAARAKDGRRLRI